MTRAVVSRTVFRAAVALWALSVLWLALDLGGPDATKAFADVVATIVPLAAAIACFYTASRPCPGASRAWRSARRRSWELLGSSALAWGFGQGMWAFYELALGQDVPFPSLADAGSMLALPLAAAGLLAYPTGPARPTDRARTVLDGLTVAAALLFLSWVTVLGPIYQGGGDPLERVLVLAYPLGDVVLGTIAFARLGNPRRRVGMPFRLVAVAIVALAISDSGFAYLTQQGTYQSGSLIDLGWVTAHLILLVVALWPGRTPAVQPSEDEGAVPSNLDILLPYGLVALVWGAAMAVQVMRQELGAFLVFDAAVLGLLVVGRQLIQLVENRRLNRQLEIRNDQINVANTELRDTNRMLWQIIDRLSCRERDLEAALGRELDTAEKLRDASAMKDTFLRAVSHDLRTPLTAIVGVGVTLERTKLNIPREQALDLIRMLVEKAQKLDRLLADLLDLNRLEEGVLEPNRQPTDIPALLKRVVKDIDQLNGWPVEVQSPPRLVAEIDGPKVERIIENLLLNTTRHTAPGTRVWVRAVARGRSLELVVADAGPGVPKELADTIFEAYQRNESREGIRRRSVGIGLSLVSRFAELHGGRAWVDERAGGGAAFHVLLPDAILAGKPRHSAILPRL